MKPSRPEIVVLGEGVYSRAVAQVFGALTIPDDWLIRQRWGAATTFSAPLVGCRRVFQVTFDTESSGRAHWRQDAFWRLYGKLGGKSIAASGLKWVLLDCRNSSGIEAVLSNFCLRVPGAGGLAGILAACGQAEPHTYIDWHDSVLAEKEVKIRREIFRLVRNGERTVVSQDRIRNLAKDILPLGWERFCPYPPPKDHALANRIRAWLMSWPDTDLVTPWFEDGESLLRQTTLSP